MKVTTKSAQPNTANKTKQNNALQEVRSPNKLSNQSALASQEVSRSPVKKLKSKNVILNKLNQQISQLRPMKKTPNSPESRIPRQAKTLTSPPHKRNPSEL